MEVFSNQLQFSPRLKKIYDVAIFPNTNSLVLLCCLMILDFCFLGNRNNNFFIVIEFFIGISTAFFTVFIGNNMFQSFFENYLLEKTLEDKKNINTELLSLGNFLAKSIMILIVVFIFAQTHQINLIGLVASLGVAGAAIAFASQKILEQILWSVVIYVDSPFKVGDYIHLPDRTMGKVEEIGWRSTKVRISGKNILAIIPNSNLAQVKIENLSQAKRAILLVEVTFLEDLSDEEKALINQLILQGTSEILGIDHQLTQVKFYSFSSSKKENKVKAEAIFYVLGAAEVSMELRKSLLEIARNKITNSLNNYGINFEVKDKIVEITQPMNM